MAVRITYNAKNIDFPSSYYRINVPEYPREALRGKSAAGIVETLGVRHDVVIDLGFRNFKNDDATNATFKRNLKQFESWAQAGNTWTLALDSGDTFMTTLTNSPAAGATVLSLTSATGVVAGRHYVVRNEFDAEVVKVASIASLDVTLTESLNWPFYAGDRVRAEMYWPARLAGDRPIIIERPPLWFDVEIPFMEDLSLL
jgi:hypothetical protein